MGDNERCPWCGSLLHTNQVGRAWCSNVAVLRERCYRVREYFSNREASK